MSTKYIVVMTVRDATHTNLLNAMDTGQLSSWCRQQSIAKPRVHIAKQHYVKFMVHIAKQHYVQFMVHSRTKLFIVYGTQPNNTLYSSWYIAELHYVKFILYIIKFTKPYNLIISTGRRYLIHTKIFCRFRNKIVVVRLQM